MISSLIHSIFLSNFYKKKPERIKATIFFFNRSITLNRTSIFLEVTAITPIYILLLLLFVRSECVHYRNNTYIYFIISCTLHFFNAAQKNIPLEIFYREENVFSNISFVSYNFIVCRILLRRRKIDFYLFQ